MKKWPVKSISVVCSVLTFALAFYYTIAFFIYHRPLYMLFTHVLLFWAAFAAFAIVRNKYTHGILFLVIGYMTLLIGNPGNMWGVIFLCFAVQAIEKTFADYYIFIIGIGIMLAKGIIAKLDIINFLNYFLGAAALVLIYYLVNIKTEKKIKIVANVSNDEILDMMISGMGAKEIGYKMGITASAVNKHLKRLRDDAGCETTAKLVYNYAVALSGKSSNNSDNSG